MSRPRLLLTLPDVPFPTDRGMRLRCAALLRALTALADVDLAVVVPAEADPPELDLPEGVGVGRAVLLRAPLRPPVLAAAAAVRRGLPWRVAVREHRAVEDELLRRLPGAYDVVWFGSLDHEDRFRRLAAGCATVVDLADLETEKCRAFLALPPQPGAGARVERLQRRLELPLWARAQRRALSRNAAVTVCSQVDRERLGADNVVVVPNTYPEPAALAAAEGAGDVLLMAGNWTYEPNADAASVAARDVLPRVRASVPGARLRLVGPGSEGLASLADLPGVDVVGRVPEMTDELLGAALTLVPVRYGGGTRLKVLEALAHGVPVVSTRMGVEGIDLSDGVDVLLAEDPQGLAEACVRLLAEPAQRARLARQGRERYLGGYRPQVADAAVRQALARTGALAPSS